MSIKCSKCGADLSEDTLFCPKCGTKVEKPSGISSKPAMVYDPNHKKEQYAELMRTNEKFRKLVKYRNLNLIFSAIVIIIGMIAIFVMNSLKVFSYSDNFKELQFVADKMSLSDLLDLSKQGFFNLILPESDFLNMMKDVYPIFYIGAFSILGIIAIVVFINFLTRKNIVKVFLEYNDTAVFQRVSRKSVMGCFLPTIAPMFLSIVSFIIVTDTFDIKVPTFTGYEIYKYRIFTNSGLLLLAPFLVVFAIGTILALVNEFGISKEICSFYKGKKSDKLK